MGKAHIGAAGKALAYQRSFEARLRRDRPEYVLFRTARRSSSVNGIPFNIDQSDVVIPEFCPVLGIRLAPLSDMAERWARPSLDRTVPELGYVKGNVTVVSWRANWLKSDATADEMRMLAAFYAR